MEGWAEARVRDGRDAIEIKPAIQRRLEPITQRLRKSVPLGRNQFFVPLDFDPSGKFLWGYTDRSAAALDLERGRIDAKIEWPAEPRVLRVELSADKRELFVGRAGMKPEQVVSDGKTKTVHRQTGRLDAYDLKTGRKLPTFDGREPGSIFNIAASSDGKWLAFNERRKIAETSETSFRTVLWDLASNRSVEVGSTHVDLVISPDSSQLFANDFNTATKESTLFRWTIPNPKSTTIATAKDAVLYTPEFSRDGRWMVLRRSPLGRKTPMELELWDRTQNRVVATATQDAENLSHAVFDPKGRWLVLVDAATGVRLLDLTNNSLNKAFDLPRKSTIWTPSFSPDGSRLALIANDFTNANIKSSDADAFDQPTLWLVDMSRPTQPERAVLPPGPSSQFVWSPDGTTIVARGMGRMLILNATNVNSAKP